MMNFKRTTLSLAAAIGGWLIAASPSFGATATGTFPVTAIVTNTCTVSSSGVAFGSYTGAAVANTANNIVVTCNKGVTITSLYIGNGANPSGAQKRMANGTDYLNYSIDVPTGALLTTCPPAGTNEWNATTGPTGPALSALFTTTGGAKNISICASIPASQYPAAGNYSDTVTMTLTY